MPVIIKIGKGSEGSPCKNMDFGLAEGAITDKMLDMTFRQYAEAIAKQGKIKDGEIELKYMMLHRTWTMLPTTKKGAKICDK